jgi:uncharacterized protein YbjT (DUF2867 family)
MKKTAVLIGASGLTGGHLQQQLLEHPAYDRVISLVRRPSGFSHPKLTEHVIDFEQPDPALLEGQDFFCALGTTLARAGSKEAQYKVDCQYPLALGKIAKEKGFSRYLLVSSIGANASSSNFYLRTKGELEKGLEALGFDTFVAARPSFLLGNRKEFRVGEKIGIWVWKFVQPFLGGPLRRLRGIPAASVATALIQYANPDNGWKSYPMASTVAKGLVYFANAGFKGCFYPEYDELISAAKAGQASG